MRPSSLVNCIVAVCVVAAAATSSACSSCNERPTEPQGTGRGGQATKKVAPSPTARPVLVGTVTGVVRLAPDHDLPSRAEVPRVPNQPAPPAPPASCSPPRLDDRQPVALTADRGLGGMLVAAADFHDGPPPSQVTHRVEIRDCRLTPRLVVATVGDTLHIENHTEYPFMPTLGGGGMLRALLKDQSRDIPLDHGAIVPLTCAFAAPCGQTDVVIMAHPVHVITDPTGHFRITNLPANQDIVLHAWHPLFREGTAHVRVAPGQTTEGVEITVEPAPAAPPPSPSPSTSPEVF